jgi:serine/threonine protein kinase
MVTERHARIKQIFLTVSALPAAARQAMLETECGDDSALRGEVESLLAYHADGSILAASSASSVPPRIARVISPPGSRVSWAEEQRAFLHRRVRLWALVVQLLTCVLIVRSIGFLGSWTRLTLAAQVALWGGGFLLLSLGTWVLLLRTASSRRLRICEMAMTICAAAMIFTWSYGWLRKGVALSSPPSPTFSALFGGSYWAISPERIMHFQTSPSLLSFPVGNIWSFLTGLYCLIIPNSWRRNGVTIGMLVLALAASVLLAAGNNPHLRPYAAVNILSCSLQVLMFGALCSYISAQFQSLRRAVFDAKQVGPYQLQRLLGSGAMGEVYLAQHRLLRRPCAVKLIQREQAENTDWLRRFEREVQAMAQLTHPNTVEVYDFGFTAEGSFFYAMEYLPGTTLDALVRSHGPLPAGRGIYLLLQVCGALAEAHSKGLVHRDIKPGNIVVGERGGAQDFVKLLDFGLVHVHAEGSAQAERHASQATPRGSLDAAPVASHRPPTTTEASPAPLSLPPSAKSLSTSRLTHAGQILGTPSYMAPEQIRGLQPDTRSDIYSLGAVACYLLTGRPPFERDLLVELYAAHLDAPVPHLRDWAPDLSAQLDAIIACCLAKEPAARYQSVGEVAAALRSLAEASSWDNEQAEAWWRTHAAPTRAGSGVEPPSAAQSSAAQSRGFPPHRPPA